jgi:hypothetical protein
MRKIVTVWIMFCIELKGYSILIRVENNRTNDIGIILVRGEKNILLELVIFILSIRKEQITIFLIKMSKNRIN